MFSDAFQMALGNNDLVLVKPLFCFSSFRSRKLWYSPFLSLSFLQEVILLVTFVEDVYLSLHLLKCKSRILPMSSPDEGVCWDCALLRGPSE